MPPPAESWDEWFYRMLCNLYKRLGGDCKDLIGSPEDRVAITEDLYKDKGAPTFATPEEKAEFLKALDDLEEVLNHPDNDLTPSADATLRGLITSLRKDVGP